MGLHPNSLAFSPDSTHAYVTNQFSNNVSVIDTSANAVTGTFAVGASPTSVAVSPNGQSVYVGCAGSGTVEVHGASGNLAATIGGFNYPKSIALTPDGSRAYVVNENGGTVSVIATGSNSVVAPIAVGLLPSSVAISADSSTAYVTNQYGLSLSVISTANEFRDRHDRTDRRLSGGSRCALILPRPAGRILPIRPFLPRLLPHTHSHQGAPPSGIPLNKRPLPSTNYLCYLVLIPYFDRVFT